MSQPRLEWIRQSSQFNTIEDDWINNDSTYYASQRAIAVDALGNSYVAYYTNGGTVSGQTNTSGNDIVVFKLSPVGDLVWVKQQPSFNSDSDNYAPTIAIDSAGNPYIAYFTDGGTVPGGTNTGNDDIVVFKLNATNGNLIWVVQNATFNTSDTNTVPSIAVDAAGNAYIAYKSYGIVSGGTNSGQNDIVVFKLNSSGAVQWTAQQPSFNTPHWDIHPYIAVDDSANVLVTYDTRYDISGETLQGDHDVVVFKLNGTTGANIWTKQAATFNTGEDDYTGSIVCDSNNNVIVAYTTYGGTVSGGTNTGSEDIVVFKLDSTGSLLWTKQTSDFNTESNNKTPCVDVDAAGNIYVAFKTQGTVPGGESVGAADIAIFKLSPSGVFQWVTQQPDFNTSQWDRTPSLALDNAGNIFVTYDTRGTTSGQENTGNHDVVVFKLSQESNHFCARVNPFLALDTTFVYNEDAISTLVAGLPLTASARVSWAPTGVTAGTLLRDLNAFKVVANGSHLYKFVRVQNIAGADTEGVAGSLADTDAYQTGWICVWAADGVPPVYA